MRSVLDEVEFPSGWAAEPLGRLMRRSKESSRPDLQPLSVFLDDGVVPRSTRDDNRNKLGEDMSEYLVVAPGDIVFNKLRTWQGGLGVSKYEGIVSPAYFVCRPNVMMEPRFLHYLFRSQPYLAELTRVSKFMPPSQFDIGWDDLRRVRVIKPSLSAQRAIANYLDAETARIDTLVAMKDALVARLNERIDAMVMRHTGASEICGGEQPAAELRRELARMQRPVQGRDVVTAYRDGQVTARRLRRAEGYTESASDDAVLQLVDKGDVVVHGLDGFAGAIGTSEANGMCSPVYHVLRPRDGGDPDFYGRLLHLLATSGYLGLFATSTRERAVDLRNWDLLGRIPIPRVASHEQVQIGRRIRALRPLIQAVRRSRALAQEHRQALITAAVTGELDIPGAA